MRKDTQGIMKKTKYAIALAALGVLSLGVMGCGKKETSTEATTEPQRQKQQQKLPQRQQQKYSMRAYITT